MARRTGNTRVKTKAPKLPEGPIKIRWELHELPSAQHKAGLAGLALCVEYLQRKPDRQGLCRVAELDSHSLTLEVDRVGMQSLFDDVYAASKQEQERDKKLQKGKGKDKQDIPPLRSFQREYVDKKGRTKAKTLYVYEQTIPKGGLIDEWDAAPSGAKKLWLKLWRDLVWSVLRGVPAQREPYNARAEGETSTDGTEVWDDLARAPNGSTELPSTYYLGAQARSAELVAFQDVTRWRYLLHFWPFAVAIYVPSILKRNGEREFTGYALGVPEIDDLEAFVHDWARLARERSPEPDRSGFRPREAIIDLPDEAGLDVARRMFSLLAAAQGAAPTAPWAPAVEIFHVEKQGNNVRLRAVGRVDAVRARADEYGRVRNAYWSHLFRRQRILNVLDGQPWWSGFGRLCATQPSDLTSGSTQFRHDARIAFTEVEMTVAETEAEAEKSLEELVYRAVRTYVYGRLGSKYDLQWDATKAVVPSWKLDYEKKREKVARDAFLAVRSRTGADFVSYFTGTLCSVPQRLDDRGYLQIARAFTSEGGIERVRSLTLLALSATA